MTSTMVPFVYVHVFVYNTAFYITFPCLFLLVNCVLRWSIKKTTLLENHVDGIFIDIDVST